MAKTIRQEMFEEKLSEMQKKVYASQITFVDAVELMQIGHKLLLGFDDMRKSRDDWKKRYEELKEKKK